MVVAALMLFAAVATWQVHRQVGAAQRHEADALARSLAGAGRLPLSVLDRGELTRLTARFASHDHVLFVALLDERDAVVASAVNDQRAWSAYQGAAIAAGSFDDGAGGSVLLAASDVITGGDAPGSDSAAGVGGTATPASAGPWSAARCGRCAMRCATRC